VRGGLEGEGGFHGCTMHSICAYGYVSKEFFARGFVRRGDGVGGLWIVYKRLGGSGYGFRKMVTLLVE
jgi:hypothetical protein